MSRFGSDSLRMTYDVAMRVVFIGNVVMRNANETVSSMMVSRVLSVVLDASIVPLLVRNVKFLDVCWQR